MVMNAPSVLQVFQSEAPAQPEGSKNSGRRESPARERKQGDTWSLGVGALGVKWCDVCANFGLPEKEHFFPVQATGECPLDIKEREKRPVYLYTCLKALYEQGVLSEEKIKPFRDEFIWRLENEPGFKEAFERFRERQAARRAECKG